MKPRRQFYTDTGGRLFKRHVRDRGLAFQLIDPVYDVSQHRRHFRWSTNLLERLLPDELCYLPKHYRDTSQAAFLGRFTAQPIPEDWQEFIWRGAPFGFHMQRSNTLIKRSRADEIRLLEHVLRGIAGDRIAPVAHPAVTPT